MQSQRPDSKLISYWGQRRSGQTCKLCLWHGREKKSKNPCFERDLREFRVWPAPERPNDRTLSQKPGPGKHKKNQEKSASAKQTSGKQCKVRDQTQKVISHWGQRRVGQTCRLSRWNLGRGQEQEIKKNPPLNEIGGNLIFCSRRD